MKIKIFIIISYFVVFNIGAIGQIVTVNQHGYITKRQDGGTADFKTKTEANEPNKEEDSKIIPVEKPKSIVHKFYSPLKILTTTSSFGLRKHPITGKWKQHSGIDLKAYYEPVYNIADGIVKFAGWGDAEGFYVVVLHGDVETVYCHLSKLLCKKGDVLKGGEVLGISGNSGRSSGPHLHLGVKYNSKRINPSKLFKVVEL